MLSNIQGHTVNYFATAVLTLTISASIISCGKKPEKQEVSSSQDQVQLADEQTITLNINGNPLSLDPQKVSDSEEAHIIRQLFEGLTSTDLQGNTTDGIASSWDSSDNKVWIFKLKQANWSNGDPVTADDFVYSFRRLVDPKTQSPYASYLADAKVINAQAIIEGKKQPTSLGVKAIDDKTLQITLAEPVPYLPDMMMHMSVKPVHKKAVEKFGKNWTDPHNIVVNGAYTLSVWNKEKIVLQRNQHYYNNKNTTIDMVTFVSLESDEQAIDSYKKGSIDYTEFTDSSQFFEVLKKDLKSDFYVEPYLCTYFYSFNVNKAPFNDERVRRALSLTSNRDFITGQVLGLGQIPAYQFTPPTIQSTSKVVYIPEWTKWDKQKRLKTAQKLLADAGYNANNPLSFEMISDYGDPYKKVSDSLNTMWQRDFGSDVIKMKAINQKWDEYINNLQNGTYQMIRATWCGDYNEPSTFLNILQSNHANNISHYNSKGYDNLINSSLKAGMNDNQRAKIYTQIEAQIDQDVPLIPIYHSVKTKLQKPYLINFYKDNPLATWLLKDVTIAEHATDVSE